MFIVCCMTASCLHYATNCPAGPLWSRSTVCCHGQSRESVCHCYWGHGLSDLWLHHPAALPHCQRGKVSRLPVDTVLVRGAVLCNAELAHCNRCHGIVVTVSDYNNYVWCRKMPVREIHLNKLLVELEITQEQVGTLTCVMMAVEDSMLMYSVMFCPVHWSLYPVGMWLLRLRQRYAWLRNMTKLPRLLIRPPLGPVKVSWFHFF